MDRKSGGTRGWPSVTETLAAETSAGDIAHRPPILIVRMSRLTLDPLLIRKRICQEEDALLLQILFMTVRTRQCAAASLPRDGPTAGHRPDNELRWERAWQARRACRVAATKTEGLPQ